jgi:hypothetical protein
VSDTGEAEYADFTIMQDLLSPEKHASYLFRLSEICMIEAGSEDITGHNDFMDVGLLLLLEDLLMIIHLYFN